MCDINVISLPVPDLLSGFGRDFLYFWKLLDVNAVFKSFLVMSTWLWYRLLEKGG